MAITDINISEKLTAGAPPIKYEGDMRPTNDQGTQMAGPAGYHRLLEHFLNLGYPYEQAGDLAMQAWRSGDLAPSDQEYEPKAFGGIAGLDGRRRYFLGSVKKLFKKVTKPIKKVAKKLTSNKLARLAALAAATYYGGQAMMGKNPALKKWVTDAWLGKPKIGALTGKGPVSWAGDNVVRQGGIQNLIGKFPGGLWGLAGSAAAATPFLMGDEQDTLEEVSGEMSRGEGLPLGDINETIIEAYKAGPEAVNALAAKYPYLVDRQYIDVDRLAQGGRIGAQEGGLMDLGGMEKDYREEGGFVPIGGQEKADDVPARLSKNEFVFTADAVRNAGGGDIDKGAEIMENVMKNLEAGGEISEESQGRQGAREMFATSERLSEII